VIIGTSRRVRFAIPGAVPSGTVYVSVSGTDSTSAPFASDNCAQLDVTHTSVTLAACVPTSSLGVYAPVTPGPVTAYVPKGWWGGSVTGIKVVQVETGGGPVVPAATVPTTSTVNSCAVNPATGEAVCVANDTKVYTLSGAAITNTLNSSSNANASFSGGACRNCGVAINALTNQAVIAMGLSPSPSNSGIQILDLGPHTFQPPIAANHVISEDISIDPTRGYILSPGESGFYDLFTFNSTTGAVTGQVSNYIATLSSVGGQIGGELDSAAEDCTTGLALTVGEFTENLYVADLTQKTSPGPGLWTAPQKVEFLSGASLSAGASGVTVAPGSSHLGYASGEFGGASFVVFQLPATSGSGTPGLVDYAVVPSTSVPGFSAGFDPHTMTAYTSPNDGKAWGLQANWASGSPTSLLKMDLAAILAAPRVAGTHTVSVANLVTAGLVSFIPAP
ncbi:MAG: hypothetical protein NTW28_01225, partial [Candidatus Solibacter sp.]|nr:hypothetical protein [Candidatus Solibacter sp.]